MKKLRKNINQDTDILVYSNEDYLIYKKDGVVTGTFDSSLDLLWIGAIGLKALAEYDFVSNKDWNSILDDIIKEIHKHKKHKHTNNNIDTTQTIKKNFSRAIKKLVKR